MEEIQFPQFRKLSNDKSWFRVDSATSMTEIQIIGSSYVVHELEAKILPERNLISDVLEMEGDRWKKVNSSEFEKFLSDCEANLKKVVF
ncbi:hypothetical protein [Halocola ammonii]